MPYDEYEDANESEAESDAPQLIPRLNYTKSWEDPADYATYQVGEWQNRRDIQSLFTEIATYVNGVLLPRAEQLIANAGHGGSGYGYDGYGGGVTGNFLPITGGKMEGILRLYRNPMETDEAVTKEYVDDAASTVRTDMEDNISAISQRADAIELIAQNSAGAIGDLSVTANAITQRVADAEGNISTLQQTAQSLTSRVSNAEGDISTINQTVNGITMTVSTVTRDGEVYARIALRIGEGEVYGYIKMDGNVQVSGQLSAEALYAKYGEVANLAVDQLITTRRVVKYLRGDTSDDNFIRAYEQNLEWVTGHYNGGVAQARDPNGAPLYWPVDVSGLSRGSDGYPVTGQGERIFTTTAPTAYPVNVYTYDEAVKRSISFEPVGGIYSPIDRFGAGNQYGTNQAWILKTANGFDIRYLTPGGKEIGIRMTTNGAVEIDGFEYDADAIKQALGLNNGGMSVDGNGYLDLFALRKPLGIDFSRVSEDVGMSSFTEYLEGGVWNTYTLWRDDSGRIHSITYPDGEVMSVIWPETEEEE